MMLRPHLPSTSGLQSSLCMCCLPLLQVQHGSHAVYRFLDALVLLPGRREELCRAGRSSSTAAMVPSEVFAELEEEGSGLHRVSQAVLGFKVSGQPGLVVELTRIFNASDRVCR